MRDLALCYAGYIFSKSGHFLIKIGEDQYSSILTDARLGMKFDVALKLYVIEILGTIQ